LVLLGGAGLHFVGGDENVVGARGHFHGGFANALENLGEIVEHVVDGVGDVAESVVGDFAAQGELAASDLIDDREEFGDATLQIFAGFLIGVGLGDFGDSAIQVFGDVAKLVVGLQVGAGTGVASGEPLRKFGELLHGSNHRAAEPPDK